MGDRSLKGLVRQAMDAVRRGDRWHFLARDTPLGGGAMLWPEMKREVESRLYRADWECELGRFGYAGGELVPWPDENEWSNYLSREPVWLLLQDATDFAAELDTFFGNFECRSATAALARDCRDDLDLLGVLADWCEDNGQPHAAAEARHLASLVPSYRMG